MGKFSIYNIPLKSLAEQCQIYEYTLDNDYFALVSDNDSEVKRGNIGLSLEVKREALSFELTFKLAGTVFVPCNRCLDDMPIEVETENRLIVKFGKEYSEESDEIVVIPESEEDINIAWFVYEFISLSIPIKHVHLPGKCNKLMSSKLDKHRVADVNEVEEDEETDSDMSFDDGIVNNTSEAGDNRWDTLKEIKFED